MIHRTHERLIRRISVTVLLIAGSCSKADKGEKETTVKAEVAASTVTATIMPFTRTLPAIGVVVARPDHYASLSAPSATRIAKVYVASGQRVSAGTPLVEFDQSQFSGATSAAQAALSAAQSSYDRAKRLADQGILPRKEEEQAAADLAKARADAATAERAKQLSVLRSPINGVVTKLSAVLGAPADAGQVLVEIGDPSAFDVMLSLAPSELTGVYAGANVQLSSGEKGGGESLGSGRIASIGATVDSATRAVQIRVSLTSPSRALKLGETVSALIAVGTRSSVVIPVDALVPGDEVGTYKVFVVDAKGVTVAKDVKVGGRNDTSVEIVDGLSGGEKIVSKGAFTVNDSAKVVKPEAATP